MRRIFGLICIVTLAILLLSCSGKKEVGRSVSIGIISIIEHPFLEQARQGFIDEMKKLGYIDGDNIAYDYRNAYGKIDNAATIAAAFVGNKVDLIYSIATPTTQAVKERTSQIPIVFAAVTDPVGAGLVKSLNHPGGNVTGVSDKIPVTKQLQTIKAILPTIKKLGVPYNAGEANSASLVAEMKTDAPAFDIDIVEATATTTSDVAQAINSLTAKVDAIYMPTDNTMAAAVDVISNICMSRKIPFFSSENETIKSDGALASLSVDHYQLGVQAARMADEILKGTAAPADIPVEHLSKFEIIINLRVATALGITVTPEAQAGAVLIQ